MVQPFSFRTFSVIEGGNTNVKTVAEQHDPVVKSHFTKAELEEVQQQAYANGLKEGHVAGMAQAQQENAEREQELNMALRNLSGQMVSLLLQHQNFLGQQRIETTKLALAVAYKTAGQAMEKNPMPEIEHLISELLDMLVGQPHVMVTVKSELQPLAKQRIEEALQSEGFKGNCTIKGDATLPPGDCRIEWENGQAEKNQQILWNKIEEIIKQRFAVNSYIHSSPTPTAGE